MPAFDVIGYLRTLTGYDFDDATLTRIAEERGMSGAESLSELTRRQKDLATADMLKVVYTTPTKTSSLQKQHGAWQQAVGSQEITDKRNIYAWMMALYRKWGEEADEMGGSVSWVVDD